MTEPAAQREVGNPGIGDYGQTGSSVVSAATEPITEQQALKALNALTVIPGTNPPQIAPLA